MKRMYLLATSLGLFLLKSTPLYAHEAYVLTKDQWDLGTKNNSFEALGALRDPHNLSITLMITSAILLALALNFIFRLTSWGKYLHRQIEKLSLFGPLVVRCTFAIALFFSAYTGSFFGPELSLTLLPFAEIIRAMLFVISVCIFFGIATEWFALITLILYSIASWYFGWYILTYLNYFGEILVLVLFGSRKWSIDEHLFGKLKRFVWLKQYETTIVRICYGFALIYAAVTIKFLHPLLTVTVVNEYNLTQFYWLFPSDPLLVTLGAALAEIAIGLFIVFGFEMRFAVLISLFYITLSLLYFGEAVWPHLLLYGISFNLLVEPEVFTLDHFFSKRFSGKKILQGLLTHGKKDLDHPIHK